MAMVIALVVVSFLGSIWLIVFIGELAELLANDGDE